MSLDVSFLPINNHISAQHDKAKQTVYIFSNMEDCFKSLLLCCSTIELNPMLFYDYVITSKIPFHILCH